MTDSSNQPIIPPPEVEALLDEASVPNGPYSAVPTVNSIRLVDSAGQTVREVLWPQAGQWARNILVNVAAATKGNQSNG